MSIDNILIIFFIGAFVGVSLTIWISVAIWLFMSYKEENDD